MDSILSLIRLLGLKMFNKHWLIFLVFASLATISMAQNVEICDNAIDDDGNGLIDLNDPACNCSMPEPPSLIPNPSFEDRGCCPSGNSQLNCADTWIQASEATTDYYHRCGYFMRDQFPVPLPIPDGDAYIGFRNGRFTRNPNPNWKEYTGACLLAPLEAGNQYTFQFYIGFVDPIISPAMNVVFYGTTDCANLPFGDGDREFGCPTNGPGWISLGSAQVSGSNTWNQYEITVTPQEDITAIAIGPNCRRLNLDINPYYFLDNLILANTELFGPIIEEIGHPCSSDFTLRATEKKNAVYQWYKDGIAILGATGRELQVRQEEGEYQVVALRDSTCLLSSVFNYVVPEFSANAAVQICPGDIYTFGGQQIDSSGSYTAIFQSRDGCDSTVFLDLEVLSEAFDTLEAYFLKGERYQIGSYAFDKPTEAELGFTSTLGCDSLVFLKLEEYPIYIPNAFSPNGDGINDSFQVFGNQASN